MIYINKKLVKDIEKISKLFAKDLYHEVQEKIYSIPDYWSNRKKEKYGLNTNDIAELIDEYLIDCWNILETYMRKKIQPHDTFWDNVGERQIWNELKEYANRITIFPDYMILGPVGGSYKNRFNKLLKAYLKKVFEDAEPGDYSIDDVIEGIIDLLEMG